jgi:energy-coupling factor transport system permease protein
MTSHPLAWAAWFVAAAGVVLVVDDPPTSMLAIGTTSIVASRLALPGPEGRAWSVMLRLGFAFLVLRVVLFGLTGHTGPTMIVTLPRAELPAWLGGFGIGGRITGEVVAQAASEGLKIAALLLACGVIVSVLPVHRIVRALPRFAFEAGLVVGIALAFAPTVLRTAADVRDAQRLRGHRFRGLRSWRPLVIPVLESALERSLTLAASMETRGFGRASTPIARGARALSVAGAAGVCVGGGLAIFGSAAGSVIAAAGLVALVAGARALGAAQRRTRYRPDRFTGWDAAVIAGAVIALGAAVVARATGTGAWYAYPVVSWPAVAPAGTLAALALGTPVVLDAARRARIVRASERQPEMAGVAP